MSNAKLTKNQKKWVAALRSAKYKQGRNLLAKIDGDGNICHCCLGVACEIYGAERMLVDNAFYFTDNKGYENGSALPYDIKHWLGVSRSTVLIRHGGLLDTNGLNVDCVDLNDQWGLTFDQIADVIEYFGLD